MMLILATSVACAPAIFAPPLADDGPAFRPDRWFEGRTRSFGVLEDRAGAPTSRFAVDGDGRREADGTLTLRQIVRMAGQEPFERLWHLRTVEGGRTIATGPAIRGEGVGELHGRLWHLTYTETLPPGGWLRTVRFEHWMYLSADGTTLVNRFTIRKLGVVVARATEIFGRAPD